MKSTMITPFDAIDTLFHSVGRRHLACTTNAEGETLLRPRTNLYELENEFVIEAELPGVSKDDLSVEVENGRLTFSAHRKLDESTKENAIHVERNADIRYSRSFNLGEQVDADAIKAQLENGVLRLSLPKQEKALPRRISVN